MKRLMRLSSQKEITLQPALAELRELKRKGSSLELIYTLELLFRALFKELFLILLPSARKVSPRFYLVSVQELSVGGYRVEWLTQSIFFTNLLNFSQLEAALHHFH